MKKPVCHNCYEIKPEKKYSNAERRRTVKFRREIAKEKKEVFEILNPKET